MTLSINHLSAGYGRGLVLHDLTLTANRGEVGGMEAQAQQLEQRVAADPIHKKMVLMGAMARGQL